MLVKITLTNEEFAMLAAFVAGPENEIVAPKGILLRSDSHLAGTLRFTRIVRTSESDTSRQNVTLELLEKFDAEDCAHQREGMTVPSSFPLKLFATINRYPMPDPVK